MRSLRFRELKTAGVPFTRKHITHMEKQGTFPPHFVVGEKTVLWVADEVEEWVAQRVRARRLVPIPQASPPKENIARNFAGRSRLNSVGPHFRPPGRPRKIQLGDDAPAPPAAMTAAPPAGK